MDDDLAARIKSCMAEARINNEQLAAACGVAPPTSFHWASGKTKKIKAIPLLKAARLFGVTPEWLASGTLPKYADTTGKPYVSERAPVYISHPANDKLSLELVSLFAKLDKAHKHEFLGQLRGFVYGLGTHIKDPPPEQIEPANIELTGTHD